MVPATYPTTVLSTTAPTTLPATASGTLSNNFPTQLNRALCSWAFSSVFGHRTMSLWRHLDGKVSVYLGGGGVCVFCLCININTRRLRCRFALLALELFLFTMANPAGACSASYSRLLSYTFLSESSYGSVVAKITLTVNTWLMIHVQEIDFRYISLGTPGVIPSSPHLQRPEKWTTRV